MKKNITVRVLASLLALFCCFGLFACGPNETPSTEEGGGNGENGGESGGGSSSGGTDGVLQEGGDFSSSDIFWDEWLHKTGKSFGSGENTVTVKVVKASKTFIFTVKSNEDLLVDALLDSGFSKSDDILEGTTLYRVNGMRAGSGASWVITKEGEETPLSITAPITSGDVLTITYTPAS